MPRTSKLAILPMKTAGTMHFIERTYRESGTYQWVRETVLNALEAGATRIEFGLEWQAVERQGVYRRVIADNGKGMTADQLVEFFNTFGGGGKPIGGVHENFGVGSKTSLLPWNHYGVVVVSWVDGDASMIWVQRDAVSGEYGLRYFEVEDPETGGIQREAVVEPFVDEQHGCDWAAVKPKWIRDCGTVLVLLGNSPTDDTVHGDPSRDEDDIKGISAYLNRRLWEVPHDVQIVVDELRTSEKSEWPPSKAEGHGPIPKRGPDRRTNPRTIQGARYFIEYPVPSFKGGKLETKGEMTLSDGTVVDWFLWKEERPKVHSYAAIAGYIAAVYKNELYDVTAHHSVYRSFGIAESAVRSRLWLILRPPHSDEGRYGVYPRTDRNSLLLKGGPDAGAQLPIHQWAAEFADCMPEPILKAIREARGGQAGTIGDRVWRERLIERFGSRWRMVRLRVMPGGSLTVEPSQRGSVSRPIIKPKRHNQRRGGGAGGTRGQLALGLKPGSAPAAKTRVGGGIPNYRVVHGDALGEGMLAAWHPHDPDYPEGVVLLNIDHPVLQQQIEYWQSQYADAYADDIRKEVIDAYGQIAVSKVAHSEHLKGLLTTPVVEKDLRSEAALTMSLLGLMAEEAVVATRIGGKYGKRRAV